MYETDIMVDSVVELSASEAISLGLFIGKPLVIQPLRRRRFSVYAIAFERSLRSCIE